MSQMKGREAIPSLPVVLVRMSLDSLAIVSARSSVLCMIVVQNERSALDAVFHFRDGASALASSDFFSILPSEYGVLLSDSDLTEN